MDDVLQQVQAALPEGFCLAAALERLFSKPTETPSRMSTPNRLSTPLNWPCFLEILSHLVAFAQDQDLDSIALKWDNPIFDEAKQLLIDPSDPSESSTLGYDKSIPVLRILKIETHPLGVVLVTGKASFNPSEQGTIKKSIMMAFSKALQLSLIHQEIIEKHEAQFRKLNDAESRYRDALGNGAWSAGQPIDIGELKACSKALQAEKGKLQSDYNQLAETLKQISAKGDALNGQLEPLLADLSSVKESITHCKGELDRRKTQSNVSEEDVNRAKCLQKSIEEEVKSCQNEVDEQAKAKEAKLMDIKSVTACVQEGIIPLTECIRTDILPKLNELARVAQYSTQSHADLNACQMRVDQLEHELSKNTSSLEEELEDIRNQVEHAENELSRFTEQIDQLNSSDELARQKNLQAREQYYMTQCASIQRYKRDLAHHYSRFEGEMKQIFREMQHLQNTIQEETRSYSSRNAQALCQSIDNMSSVLRELTS